MLRIPPGFGKIAVIAFYTRILIAMAELLGEANVAVVMMLFGFGRAFGAIGIVIGNPGHVTPLISYFGCLAGYSPERVETPSLRRRSRACSASVDFGKRWITWRNSATPSSCLPSSMSANPFFS
jgi:hypothetical protein